MARPNNYKKLIEPYLDKISEMAREFGLGFKTNVGIENEKSAKNLIKSERDSEKEFNQKASKFYIKKERSP